jgi:hypothetical protein
VPEEICKKRELTTSTHMHLLFNGQLFNFY